MSADSTAVFATALADLGLTDLKPKFDAKGWCCYNDFAFSSSDTPGRDTAAFETEVLSELIDKQKPEEAKLISKLRRLYATAYIVMQAHMETMAKPQGVDEKVHMTVADRNVRLDILKGRLCGLALTV